ncbi:MAG: hypothetical protein Q9N62_01140 [Ghiorsea sp.]|nr:hypothetical protein [Ghiorsea sp.]
MNILIVRNDKIGDFITALPACYLLKQHLPDCRITVLISSINQSIAERCDFIDNIIVDNRAKYWRTWQSQLTATSL